MSFDDVLEAGKRAGEFLLSEGNGSISREAATVLSGQVLVAGQVIQLDGDGKAAACDGILNTAGDALVTPVAGIVIYAADATDGDVPNCAYIARSAEVIDAYITYPTESTGGGEHAATVASLRDLGIIVRSETAVGSLSQSW
jgi:hypothetical protein